MKVSNFLNLRSLIINYYDVWAFMYDQPSTIIDYFANDVVIAVDEYNRIKRNRRNVND